MGIFDWLFGKKSKGMYQKVKFTFLILDAGEKVPENKWFQKDTWKNKNFVSYRGNWSSDWKYAGEYPGWEPDFDSPILAAMKNSYNAKYGKVPEVKIIHAGLECGVLGATYTNWDMISFGPTIRFPHSPDEKVNIATVQKFWDFLIETLKNIPAK